MSDKITQGDKYNDEEQNDKVQSLSYHGFQQVLRDRTNVTLIVLGVLAIASGAWYFDTIDAQHEVERAQDRQYVIHEIQKLNPQNITIIHNPSGVSVIAPNGSAILTNANETASKIASLIP